MNCPVCDERLRAVEKLGVEIEVCPGCKGVWLDRGELDKIIQMAMNDGPGEIRASNPQVDNRSRDEARYSDNERKSKDYDYDRDRDSRTGRPRKKSSWISDIFENFGGD